MEQDDPNQESTSKSIELTHKNELDELFELVVGDLALGVGEAELARTRTASSTIVRLQPQRLRMCSRDCSMRDTCVWITTQEEANWPDVRGKRCPIESELWGKNWIEMARHVISMDPDRSKPTDYELSICKEIAWVMVEEHRMLINTALTPEPIIRSVVPGGDGATAEEVNPRIDASSTIRKDLYKLHDRLTKAVERRLKNVSNQHEVFVKTIAAVAEEIKADPEKYKKTRLGDMITIMTKRIDNNEEERAKEEEGK